MSRGGSFALGLLLVQLLAGGTAHADFSADIGYTRLVAELGAAMPDGAGVLVTHAEAATGTVDHDNDPATAPLPIYLPDPANTQFAGKTIIDQTGKASGYYSGHATSVGIQFYGNVSSSAPGVPVIHAYNADDWLQTDFLRYGTGYKPLQGSSRVANHSWVGTIGDAASDSGLLRRLDWVIETDEFIQVVGSNNGVGSNLNLASGAYNALTVGRTDGLHSTGTNALDADYVAGRVRPELVAPSVVTSYSTAAVSSAAALLVDAAHANPGWSTDPVSIYTSNRNGDTIYNGERAEVIKAVLMTGALRATANTTGADLTDYRASPAYQAANGLDTRFGAGQLNVYNSYHILAAGEQNSDEDDGAGSGAIGVRGFDYDPAFGGNAGSNASASYHFTATGGMLTATLVWHIDIAGGGGQFFTDTATRYDLDLLLYDVTASPLLVNSSASNIDNTETVRYMLESGHDYRLQVVPKAGLDWDYALAWQIDLDSDADGIPDQQDNCPLDANADQLDTDNDGAGDACDSDDDNDGTPDAQDAFPLDPAEDTDTDNDGIGNNADTDDDGDGFDDSVEITLGHDPLNPADAPQWGDLDFNDVVDAVDVLLASRAVFDSLSPSTEQLAVGRIAPLVNGVPTPAPGNTIGAPDLLLIQQKALGLASF